ncbi:MAG: hypothetical protein HQ454_00050 [Acidimicrobiaceae bacterium]|nr:hypothetical protein [Acidimicrobiaceae bacterium]
MAVTPAMNQRSEEVLTRVTQRRQALELLVESVIQATTSLADVFERAGDPQLATDVPDAMVCRFIYLVKIAEALPNIGKVRARRVLAAHQLGERTRVGEVPFGQRGALVEALR